MNHADNALPVMPLDNYTRYQGVLSGWHLSSGVSLKTYYTNATNWLSSECLVRSKLEVGHSNVALLEH